MIQSMTAFSRAQGQGTWGTGVCELRSINHRYLELVVRLPETLHALEAAMRECIRDYIKRGKIECHVRYQPGDIAGAEFTINTIYPFILREYHAPKLKKQSSNS